VQCPHTFSALDCLTCGGPTVGSLIDLCEENYDLLLSVAPGLARMTGEHRSRLDGSVDLHLEVLEQSRYTSTVRLTYYFCDGTQRVPEPDVTLRVYHDARQVELCELGAGALPVARLFEAPGLEQKWKVNLFVSKWLAFCRRQGHRFRAPALAGHPQPLPCAVGAA
jgi:uncharacterized protein YqiB (DUF1249 family)